MDSGCVRTKGQRSRTNDEIAYSARDCSRRAAEGLKRERGKKTNLFNIYCLMPYDNSNNNNIYEATQLYIPVFCSISLGPRVFFQRQ